MVGSGFLAEAILRNCRVKVKWHRENGYHDDGFKCWKVRWERETVNDCRLG
jgi:hypothetical protein